MNCGNIVPILILMYNSAGILGYENPKEECSDGLMDYRYNISHLIESVVGILMDIGFSTIYLC